MRAKTLIKFNFIVYVTTMKNPYKKIGEAKLLPIFA